MCNDGSGQEKDTGKVNKEVRDDYRVDKYKEAEKVDGNAEEREGV